MPQYIVDLLIKFQNNSDCFVGNEICVCGRARNRISHFFVRNKLNNIIEILSVEYMYKSMLNYVKLELTTDVCQVHGYP